MFNEIALGWYSLIYIKNVQSIMYNIHNHKYWKIQNTKEFIDSQATSNKILIHSSPWHNGK